MFTLDNPDDGELTVEYLGDQDSLKAEGLGGVIKVKSFKLHFKVGSKKSD